jgi:exodeoxyribonuclease VII large subunit
MAEETRRIVALRDRARRALHGWVDRERRLLEALRSRPVLADPLSPLARRAADVDALRERARRGMLTVLSTEHTALSATRSRLTTLGPAATLARGYAVVQLLEPGNDIDGDAAALTPDGIVRSITQIGPGTMVRVRVVDGAAHAVVSVVEAMPGSGTRPETESRR